jgi:hypothetical protein
MIAGSVVIILIVTFVKQTLVLLCPEILGLHLKYHDLTIASTLVDLLVWYDVRSGASLIDLLLW